MTDLLFDLRTAARSLPRAPLLSLTIIAVLALAIGVNTTIYSVVHSVLLEELPYPEPERVVSVWIEQADGSRSRMTPGNLVDLRTLDVIESLGMYRPQSLIFTPELDDSEVVRGARVTEGYFESLGRPALHGRWFGPEDAVPGSPSVVILGEDFWARRFNRDPAVVGEVVLFNGVPFRVLGVMPTGLYPTASTIEGAVAPPGDSDFWLPERFSADFYENRRTHLFGAIGRVRSDVGFEAAAGAVGALGARLAEVHSSNTEESLLLTRFRDDVVGPVERSLLLVSITVGVVLLIGGANVAALMLVRAEERRTELALRAALGAGRGRLVRLQLAETALLAATGGLIGVAATPRLLDLIRTSLPTTIPRIHDAGVDGGVLAVSAAIVVGIALLAGTLPSVVATRSRPADCLRGATPGSGVGRTQRRLQAAMVVGQAALAVVLLVAASLLIRSFGELVAVDLGFSAGGVVQATLNVPASVGADTASMVALADGLRERLGGMTGVESVTLSSDSPVQRNWVDSFTIVGDPGDRGDDPPHAVLRRVDPAWLDTLGIQLLAGRNFGPEDDPDSAPVALINESAARRYFDGDPVGRQVHVPSFERVFGDADAATRTVVGVISDVRYMGPTAPAEPALFFPFDQFPSGAIVALIRNDGTRPGIGGAVRDTLRDLDRRIGLRDVAPLPELVAGFTAPTRFSMGLVGAFGFMGLVLASMATYALVSRVVTGRLHEYGIRLAMGAPMSVLVRDVLRSAAGPVGLGAAIGLTLAVPVAAAMRSQLFEVPAFDPWSFSLAPLVLLAAAVGAGALCVRRVVRTDPADALRGG